MTEPTPPAGVLAGVRVLDLTRILAGPFCTMMLGDMGADVLKVEQPGRGDDTRAWGPPFLGTESAYYLAVNRNKRGMTLDLKQAEGQEILRGLIRKSDIVVENFKPGTLDAWNCGWEFIAREAPDAILCTISGYGSTGPKRALPGYDFLLQAESGLMSITGEPDGEPMKLGVAIVDLCTGMYAASTILAALAARRAGAPGQHIEVSLYQTGLSLLANVGSNVLVSGKPAKRHGNAHASIVPYATYACGEGEIALAVGNDVQFRLFAEVVGHAEWADDPAFARNRDRVDNRERLGELIVEALATKRAGEWLEILLKRGVPCSRVNTVEEALRAPQTAALDMVVKMQHPTEGEFTQLGIPFSFSDTPASIRLPPPILGQHTEEVLAELLAMDSGQIRALRERGVV